MVSTLDASQVSAYLQRIGVAPPGPVDRAALTRLQLGHLLSVPFENLDIHRGVPIVLEPAAIFDKIVNRNRGGYCYELNSTFATLLIALGYGVDTVGARVARAGGGFGRDLAHMTLIVGIPGEIVPHLVDVGFGDAFTVPIPLTPGVPRKDRDRLVRLVQTGNEWAYQDDRGDGWRVQYAFTTRGRALEEFRAMNEWQQTAPESHFTKGAICSLLTVEGRQTLSGNRFIKTRHGQRLETVLAPEQINEILERRFGIVLDQSG